MAHVAACAALEVLGALDVVLVALEVLGADGVLDRAAGVVAVVLGAVRVVLAGWLWVAALFVGRSANLHPVTPDKTTGTATSVAHTYRFIVSLSS